MAKIDKGKIHKILVVRTDRMGDVLLNIPAIRALKQSFSALIVALVNPEVKELLSGCPEIDQILEFNEQQWQKSLSARLNLLRQIRKMDFDLAVILNPTKRFHLLSYLAGIPRRLGYNRKFGFLLTDKIEDSKSAGRKHEVEYNLDLVRSIGADTADQRICLSAATEEAQFVQDLLFKSGIKQQDLLIAIHPHSSNPAKSWPREHFAHLADQLYAKLEAKVVVIGGAAQRAAAIKLISLAKYSPINLSGSLNLRQLMALLQKCAILISNDSGPVHIAAAMGTPVVAIFGRNIPGVGPRRWGPWGNAHIVLHKDPGCNPCLDRKCPFNFKCLSSISPVEVFNVVKSALARNKQLPAKQ